MQNTPVFIERIVPHASLFLYPRLQGQPERDRRAGTAVPRPRLYHCAGRRSSGRVHCEQLHRDQLRRPEKPQVAAPQKARESGCGDGADRLLPAGLPGGGRTVHGSRPCVRQRRPQGHSGERTKAAGRPRAHRSHCPAPARRAVRGAAGGAVRDPHPRLYQGRGRLQPAVRLLRHPPRPRAGAQPRRGKHSGRAAPAGRCGLPRGGAQRHLPAQLRAGHRHEPCGAGGKMRTGAGHRAHSSGQP